MPETQFGCDLCGSLESQAFLTKKYNHPNYPFLHLVECTNCGLVYLDPRPDREEISSIYTDTYYTSVPLSSPPINIKTRIKILANKAVCESPIYWTWGQKILIKWIVTPVLGWRVRRRVPVRNNGLLLDVGCGNGAWLAWVKENIKGWDVEGTEINRQASDNIKNSLNITIHVDHLDKLELSEGHYDMITFWHSLEHLHSPKGALHKCYKLLKPNGWLGIEVPNIMSYEAKLTGAEWYHLALPFHLYHFSPRTLSNLLAETGFRMVKYELVRDNISIKHMVQNNSSSLPNYIRPFAPVMVKTFGHLSAWGIRVYAVKK